MAIHRILIVLLLASVAMGCNISVGGFNAKQLVGSGNIVAEEARTAGFRRVAVSHSFDLEVRQGDDFYVLLEADDNVMEIIDVVNDGETLSIGLIRGENYNLKNVTLKAEVVMPKLDSLDASGACQVVVTGFDSADEVDFDVSGACKLEGDMNARVVRIDTSGASRATLMGSADRLDLDVSGAAAAKFGDFHVREANVEASGASSAIVHATEHLDADASGASKIRYSGQPASKRTETSGASSVESE